MNVVYIDSDMRISEFINDGSKGFIQYVTHQLNGFNITYGGGVVRVEDPKYGEVSIAGSGSSFYVATVGKRGSQVLAKDDEDFVRALTGLMTKSADSNYERIYKYRVDDTTAREATQMRAMLITAKCRHRGDVTLENGTKFEFHDEGFCTIEYKGVKTQVRTGQYAVYLYGADAWFHVTRRFLERSVRVKIIKSSAHLYADWQGLLSRNEVCTANNEKTRVDFKTFVGSNLKLAPEAYNRFFEEREHGIVLSGRNGFLVVPVWGMHDVQTIASEMKGKAFKDGRGVHIVTDKFDLYLPYSHAILLVPDNDDSVIIPVSQLRATSLIYDKYSDDYGFTMK